MSDGISVDGTALATLGRVEQTWEGVLAQDYPDAVPDPVGATIPAWVPLAIPRPLTIGMLIEGGTRAEFLSRWQTLATLVDKPASTLTLTRVITIGVTVTTHTRSAKYMGGLDPTMLNERAGRVALRFQPLGPWA